MKSLFARPAPKRGRVALMLAGSLVFHGGLIGIGALFVQPPPKEVPFDWIPADEGPALPPVKVADPAEQPTTESGPTATPETVEPALSTPPPTDDPVFAEPATPTPRQRASVKPASTAPTATRRTTSLTPAVPGSGPEGGTNARPGGGMSPWVMPHPPYPATARRFSVGTGATIVRIATDASGHVSNVVIVRSTGNPILDAHTVSYVRDHWRGPANAARTTEFVYELR